MHERMRLLLGALVASLFVAGCGGAADENEDVDVSVHVVTPEGIYVKLGPIEGEPTAPTGVPRRVPCIPSSPTSTNGSASGGDFLLRIGPVQGESPCPR